MTKPSKLLEALINEPEVRIEFQRDPEAVAGRFGAELDSDTRAALQSFDWNVDSSDLLYRMNKGCLMS